MNASALPNAVSSRLRARLLQPGRTSSRLVVHIHWVSGDAKQWDTRDKLLSPWWKARTWDEELWDTKPQLNCPWQGRQGCSARRGQPQLPSAHTSLAGLWHRPSRQLSYCPQQPPNPGQPPPLLYQQLALQIWWDDKAEGFLYSFEATHFPVFCQCWLHGGLAAPGLCLQIQQETDHISHNYPRRESEVCNTAAIPSQQIILS